MLPEKQKIPDYISPEPPPVAFAFPATLDGAEDPRSKMRRIFLGSAAAGAALGLAVALTSDANIADKAVVPLDGERARHVVPVRKRPTNSGQGGHGNGQGGVENSPNPPELCHHIDLDQAGERALDGVCFELPEWDTLSVERIGAKDSKTGEVIERGHVTGNIKIPGETNLISGSMTLYLDNANKDKERKIPFEGSKINVLEADDVLTIVTAGVVYAKLQPALDGKEPSLQIEAFEGRAVVRKQGKTIFVIEEGKTEPIPLKLKNIPSDETGTPKLEEGTVVAGSCNVVAIGENIQMDETDPMVFVIIGSGLFAFGRRKREEKEAA